jgi:tetratricopeptide (TPR) repeat protein
MKTLNRFRFSTIILLLIVGMHSTPGCSRPDWFVGVGGKYNQAWEEIVRGRAGDMDKAISSLEYVVKENPTYRDSLTLLGRAYYRKGRYQDAHLILQRALAVNKDDEIAWLVFGLTQLRLGANEKGLESVKGGLTLLSKAMKENYRGYPAWDPRATVRSSLNRSALQVMKGLDEKENLIQATEQLLVRIDDEEWAQRRGKSRERSTETN